MGVLCFFEKEQMSVFFQKHKKVRIKKNKKQVGCVFF